MSKTRCFWVYILASRSRVLYIGVTNDLQRRVFQHKLWEVEGFTARYNVTRLVYFEEPASSRAAVRRERELKGWTRRKKIALIDVIWVGPIERDLIEFARAPARAVSHVPGCPPFSRLPVRCAGMRRRLRLRRARGVEIETGAEGPATTPADAAGTDPLGVTLGL